MHHNDPLSLAVDLIIVTTGLIYYVLPPLQGRLSARPLAWNVARVTFRSACQILSIALFTETLRAALAPNLLATVLFGTLTVAFVTVNRRDNFYADRDAAYLARRERQRARGRARARGDSAGE